MDFSKVKKSPIILKEENTKFALDPAREIRGYIKLAKDDDRGLIVAMMDNVKFFPRGEYVYKLILIGTKNEKRRYHLIGNLSLSAQGRGEGSFRINPRDMDGYGTSLSDFSSAVIAATSMVNAKEALHPVLKGSFSLSADTAPRPTAKDYSPFYNRFVLDSCISIARDEHKFEDIIPFEKELSSCSWKKITDVSRFPVIAPGADRPMKKYGHFLFGYNDSHYFLAVPGRFFPDEQPDGGSSGFAFWLPILGMEKEARKSGLSIDEQRKNIYGYWIAAVNRYNGHIEEIVM